MTETPNMCRVREGKFGSDMPVHYLAQCKCADHAGKNAGIRRVYFAVYKRLLWLAPSLGYTHAIVYIPSDWLIWLITH